LAAIIKDKGASAGKKILPTDREILVVVLGVLLKVVVYPERCYTHGRGACSKHTGMTRKKKKKIWRFRNRAKNGWGGQLSTFGQGQIYAHWGSGQSEEIRRALGNFPEGKKRFGVGDADIPGFDKGKYTKATANHTWERASEPALGKVESKRLGVKRGRQKSSRERKSKVS